MYGDRAEWVVVLEADTGIDDSSLRHVLENLSDLHAIALQCSSRYAVQMELDGGEEDEALLIALSRWRSALAAVGQPPDDVVRAEVVSRQAFDKECRVAYGTTPSGRWRR